MKSIHLLACLILLLPFNLYAGSIVLDTSQMPDLNFRGVQFGQSPTANMVCVHGYCKSQSPGGDGRVKLSLSSYNLSGDTIDISDVPITPPKYSFWKDQLYQVSFSLDCEPDEADACVDVATNALNEQYGLTIVASFDEIIYPERLAFHSREYVTRSGALVVTLRMMQDGTWENPRVIIYNHNMRDQVALAANPKYKAKKIRVPEGY